jgi:hypothetical protein
MKRSIANEMHKPARVNFPRRHTRIDGLRDLVQIDLIDLISYKKFNKNFSYIMLAIDCFSKYIWAYPLKTKGSSEMLKIMQTFLLKDYTGKYGGVPKLIQTDNGTEFYNKPVQNLFKSNNITHYSTFSVIKAAIAERAIRTIKSRLFKEFSVQGNYKWIEILPDVIRAYNQSKHRTIQMAPSKVNSGNEKIVLFNIRSSQAQTRPTTSRLLSVGDRVRISKHRNVFSKGYHPNWSYEIFNIDSVKSESSPPVYFLRDCKGELIKGSFYPEEIQKTNIPDDVHLIQKVLRRRRRNNKQELYVLWMDGSKSWISKDSVCL